MIAPSLTPSTLLEEVVDITLLKAEMNDVVF